MVYELLRRILYELPAEDSADAHEIKLRYNFIIISTLLYICVQAISKLWWRYCKRAPTTDKFEQALATALAEELQSNPDNLLIIAQHAASEVLRRKQAQSQLED